MSYVVIVIFGKPDNYASHLFKSYKKKLYLHILRLLSSGRGYIGHVRDCS